MTTSRREQILSEVATRLASTAGVNQRVFRSRAEAVSRGEMPCLIVEPIADTAEAIGGMCKIDRRLTIKVAVLVNADIPDQAADPILIDLYPKLISPGDTTIGGLALDIEPIGDDFQFAATDGVIITSFAIRYRHDTFTLASA